MFTSCGRMQSLIASSAEGELEESLRAKIREHTAECVDCAQAHAFCLRLQAEIESEPMESPPPVYFEGVLAEIHRRMPVRPVIGATTSV